MIKVHCFRCKEGLISPGAILFGTPVPGNEGVERSPKYHICSNCEIAVLNFILYGDWTPANFRFAPLRQHCMVLCGDGSRTMAWRREDGNWVRKSPPDGEIIEGVTHYHLIPEAL